MNVIDDGKLIDEANSIRFGTGFLNSTTRLTFAQKRKLLVQLQFYIILIRNANF